MLNASSEVAFQINTSSDPTLNRPRGYFWAPGDADPTEMIDRSTPGQDEQRSFEGIVSITDGGGVFGTWPDEFTDASPCLQGSDHPLPRRQALWLKAVLRPDLSSLEGAAAEAPHPLKALLAQLESLIDANTEQQSKNSPPPET